MDTNHDGNVSWDEAIDFFMASLKRQYPNASEEIKAKVRKMFRKLFDSYSNNN